MKRSSVRTTQEAIRKHQIESRTKKLAERMQVAGGEQDEGGRIAEVAKHKAQVIAMQKCVAFIYIIRVVTVSVVSLHIIIRRRCPKESLFAMILSRKLRHF